MKKQILIFSLLLLSTIYPENNKFITQPKVNTSKSNHKEIERTFGIIKPDAVKAKHAGEIIRFIELNNFTILRMQKIRLTKKQAERFYAAHKAKPFFKDLVNYMISGPVVLLALEKDNAIKDWRELMGSTDPKKAQYGTLRKMFGSSVGTNALHGSDSKTGAEQELFFFFPDLL